MMATAAYSDPAVLNAEHCPDPAKLVNRALAKDEAYPVLRLLAAGGRI
jgi:hypothetical protein